MATQARYCATTFRDALPEIVSLAQRATTLEEFRHFLVKLCDECEAAALPDHEGANIRRDVRVRDCAHNLRTMLSTRSETVAGFSLAQAIYDICLQQARPDLTTDFFADLHYILLGLLDKGSWQSLADIHLMPADVAGRAAAIVRSEQMDDLYASVVEQVSRYAHGLHPAAVARRRQRVQHICKVLGASETQFNSWEWQFANVQRDAKALENLVCLTASEKQAIAKARSNQLPFGITPYYLSLMDDDPEKGRDRAVRAQVIPPENYVAHLSDPNLDRDCLDFMLEHDTSPVDLITRRYPSICILKPYNTCPQICVYCQRNWEIDDAMAPGALASREEIKAAIAWIRQHPAIHEVLVTGGDPLGMDDTTLKEILDELATIPTIERIRIGTRTIVTAPMRFSEELVKLLSTYRIPGRRQVAVVTHVEHAYEITPQVLEAVERLRLHGITVFNQQVYTFFVSRRFETTLLRRVLARVGIEPYYTFNMKGKDETSAYRVPLARLLQENNEEARLLPGLSRTDEGVYNVPGQGKNYLRAAQHRTLLSLLPNGNRLYEFHPWEKNITRVTKNYIGEDVPIYSYLQSLAAIGEDVADYDTIWYYF